MIQSTPSDILASYLVTLGLAFRPGNPMPLEWVVTEGTAPIDNDTCINITDITPFTEGKIMETGETVTKPRCQIQTRSKNYNASFSQLRQITYALSTAKRVLVSSSLPEVVLLDAVKIMIQPTFLYQEEKQRRQVFTSTVQLTITNGGES